MKDKIKIKFKKFLPYILIVGGVGLLIIVSVVVMHFYDEGHFYTDRPDMPDSYELDNQSSMMYEEIMNIVLSKRDEMISYFHPLHYYNLSTIDSSSPTSLDDIYMVLTDKFILGLSNFATSSLASSLTSDFEEIKSDDDAIYYKVLKMEFDELHVDSALAIFNYTNMEIYPTYASDTEIKSMINFQICESDDKCRRDDWYEFDLVNESGKWLINNIGLD